ncbi:unnamed protein product [Ambrosiozyma monospora]|uniref:Unnamed protein product n=1 Tax=Ambrosiozyma monospora TaxID=43982 RepID=A0ACB5T537_AMBMO|nr:unnamed protein product [Ambrosiozyma monospora]
MFKPVFLPEGNPSLFSFYFDTSQRHVCYVAPERFVASDDAEVEELNKTNGELNWQMDIFSLGCVIAELYLESLPIFTLPQMFKFKRGEYYPNLDAIDDLNISKMIQSMISSKADDRLTAKEYLTRYRKTIFPDYFYTFLHTYMNNISGGITENESVNQFTVSDERIDNLYNNFDKLSLYLGFKKLSCESDDDDNNPVSSVSMIPMKLGMPGMEGHTPKSTSQVFLQNEKNDSSCLIPLSLVLHSVRNTTHASFRIQACDLIVSFAEQLHDEAKLDRCLPYLVYMLDDPSDDVQAAALRAMTQLLTMVDTITPVNVYLFQEYILPKLKRFLRRSYVSLDDLTTSSNLLPRQNVPVPRGANSNNNQKGRYVRSVFANCLPHLATTARKFYEMANLLKTQIANFEDPETENHYAINSDSLTDMNYKSLTDGFENLTVQLLTDPDPYVKTALLNNILPLCAFFGKEKTNDVILSHLITYLNDKDTQLKLSFVNSIVPISVFVGIVSLEQYILPLLAQALNEPDEMLVTNLIKAFTELAKLGLIRRRYLWDLVKLTAKLVLHPSELIRNSVLNLIVSIGNNLSVSDLYCMLYPLIRPFFQYEVTDFSWETLYVCAHKPISRAVYNMAKIWSLKTDPTLFWQRVDPSVSRTYDSFGSAGLVFMKKKTTRSHGSGTHRIGPSGVEENAVVDNSEIPLSQSDVQQNR